MLKINSILKRLRQERPLILNLTNLVTMDFVANGLLSLGASPLMTRSEEELEDLIRLSSAVVINTGTLDDEFVSLCSQAFYMAGHWNKPVTFDPVGAGASAYRTRVSEHFLKKYSCAHLRGNAGEIMALAGQTNTIKGVDSLALSSSDIKAAAQELAFQYKIRIIVSGETDWVTDGHTIESFHAGSPLMPKVTGSGCLLTAVVSAFSAVHDDAMEALCAAVVFYGRCGEKAAAKAAGPGSFRTHFLDALAGDADE